MATQREFRLHPVEPFPVLKFPREDGKVTVQALGTSLPLPGISITRYYLTGSGRGKIDYVDFESEELPGLMEYLQDALNHWKEG